MAVPAWVGAVAQGGAGILSPIISGVMNRRENQKSKEFNLEMAIADKKNEWNKWNAENAYSEKVWNMQNQYNEQAWHKMNNYNSPMAQMERFKEAGLNPNLIYGQSNSTSPIATASFGKNSLGNSKMPTSNPTQWDFSGAASAIGGGLNTMLNMRESSARVNNLEAQNDVLKQDAIKRAAETAGLNTDNQSKQVQLKVLSETAMDAAELANNRMRIGTQIDLERNEREAIKNASDVREAAERILNLRGQRMNQQLDTQLKQLDLNLKQMGIQPSDNMVIRMLGQLLNQYGSQIHEGLMNINSEK